MKEMVYMSNRQRENLYKDEYLGYKFVIISRGTHPVAYVECKLPNFKDEDDDRLNNVMVHGEFTYYGRAYWNENDKLTYLGWDYAHCEDYYDHGEFYQSKGKKWTTKEIYDEVKLVIEQLSKLI